MPSTTSGYTTATILIVLSTPLISMFRMSTFTSRSHTRIVTAINMFTLYPKRSVAIYEIRTGQSLLGLTRFTENINNIYISK